MAASSCLANPELCPSTTFNTTVTSSIQMAPPRRLVRRQPLAERIKAYLNPFDFLLWLSEELETSDWESWQKTWGIPLGLALNLTMLIARANVRASGGNGDDDVFGDEEGTSYLGWFVGRALKIRCLDGS